MNTNLITTREGIYEVSLREKVEKIRMKDVSSGLVWNKVEDSIGKAIKAAVEAGYGVEGNELTEEGRTHAGVQLIYHVEKAHDNIPKRLTREKYEDILGSEMQQQLVQAYRNGAPAKETKEHLHAVMVHGAMNWYRYFSHMDEAANQAILKLEEIATIADEEEKEKATKKFRQWAGANFISPRHERFVDPTGLIALDLDDCQGRAAEVFERLKDVLADLGIGMEEKVLAFYISPKGAAKIIMLREKGKTIRQEYDQWEMLLGEKVDRKCADLHHLQFLTTDADMLYRNDELLFNLPLANTEDYPLDEKENTRGRYRSQAARAARPAFEADPQSDAEWSTRCKDMTWENIPVWKIAQHIERQLGGPAMEGERNCNVFKMACALRMVADDDFDALQELIPDYGLSPQEHACAINSALGYPQPVYRHAYIKEALRDLRAQQAKESNKLCLDSMPQMPQVLPQCIEDILSSTPENLRTPNAINIFAPIGALFYDTYFTYTDNKRCETCQMVLQMGAMSSGKGGLKPIAEHLLKEAYETSRINREKEEEWKAKNKGSKKYQPRPQGLYRQIVYEECTSAAFRDLATYAEGRYLFSLADEFEDLLKQCDNKIPDLTLRIRKAYDNSLCGAERTSIEYRSVEYVLRWCFAASCTPKVGRRILGQNVLDGALSRMSCSMVHKDENVWYEPIPVYGNYDEEYDKLIKPYIDRIKETRGHVYSPEANEWALKECKHQAEIAEENNDRNYLTMSYRAVKTGFQRAMMLYVMNGNEWTEEIADFCSWSVDYDLWVKFYHFGDLMAAESQKDKETVRCVPRQNILPLLPSQFTRAEYVQFRQAQGMGCDTNTISSALSKWKSRGDLTYDAMTGIYTQTYKKQART